MRDRSWRILQATIATLLVAVPSCGPKQVSQPGPAALIIFPPPPDTARIQFLTRFRSSLDFGEKSGGLVGFLLGEKESERAQAIIKPYGIAIHRGTIYVCDTQLPGLDVIDLESRTFEHRLPAGMGQLKTPVNCFVDGATGALYVADTERAVVLRFDSAGQYLDAFGSLGLKPSDVFVSGDTVWVSDLASRQVKLYDKATRRLLFAFPDPTAATSETLHQPTNLYVRDDRVYVSDFGEFNVKIFTRDGTFVKAVGSYGLGHGQFVRPKGIAVDRDHNLYVVDAGFDIVQIFDRDGQLLTYFGGAYRGPGDMALPAKVIIDYDNLAYFQQYVAPQFTLKYLILVTNQYGPDKVSVYGFVEQRGSSTGMP